MTSDVPAPRCPWCSAALSGRRASTCPSCGAALREAEDEIPGLTRVDPALLARAQRPASRSRLLDWLSGGGSEPEPSTMPSTAASVSAPGLVVATDVATRGSLEPPSEAVRREIRRLELEALRGEMAAEAREVDDEGTPIRDQGEDAATASRSGSEDGASAEPEGTRESAAHADEARPDAVISGDTVVRGRRRRKASSS